MSQLYAVDLTHVGFSDKEEVEEVANEGDVAKVAVYVE